MHETLRDFLKARATALSQGVLARMYENPFWMARYGARGRSFADEDSLYHLQYLDQALAAEDAAVFEKYARWLRSILVSRGMCSEHLAENFLLLADAIDTSGAPSADAARAVLERGARALVYTQGDASRLEGRRTELLAAVERSANGPAMREDDRRYLVSYLIDSAATGDASGFDEFAARCDAEVVNALRAAATTS